MYSYACATAKAFIERYPNKSVDARYILDLVPRKTVSVLNKNRTVNGVVGDMVIVQYKNVQNRTTESRHSEPLEGLFTCSEFKLPVKRRCRSIK